LSINLQALHTCAEQPCCFPETGHDGEPCWCREHWQDDVRLYCPSCLARWQLSVIDGTDDTCDFAGACEDCPDYEQCRAAAEEEEDDERDWKHDFRN